MYLGTSIRAVLRDREPSRPSRFYARFTFELLGGLCLSVLVPSAVGAAFVSGFLEQATAINTIVALTLAYVSSMLVMRTMRGFPGVEPDTYLLPAFGIVYASIVVAMVLLRFEYSRILLISGILLGMSWSYFVAIARSRTKTYRIGIIDYGDLHDIAEIKRVKWHRVTEPTDVADLHLDALVADFSADIPDHWEAAIAEFVLQGLPAYHVKQLKESLTGMVELEHLSVNSVGSLTPTLAYFHLKRIIDWILAAVLLGPLLPVMLLVAVAVKLDSSGPAIFRQIRVGYRGRPFTVYKFRTMYAKSVHTDPKLAAQTQHGDPRITRLGRLLRASRLDELPQVFNILKGEMSWIGPRPEAAILAEWYEREIPFFRYRYVVLPGITGWAQVNQGHVVEVADVTGKLHHDFYYITRFSAALDLLIIFRTIQTMVSGRGHR
ncbi:sugar transferase [Croceibacterium aestuarii]|uniref:sugar transferase n=1 Tax=Croceibacterium aestuarii TaxID=3064139 RepID=UPI00272E92BF|nr:sugar transferase [Croceibacterium sp. D39]